MISVIVNIKKLKIRRRWDFSSYDPVYEQTLGSIHSSKWDFYSLGELVFYFRYGASIPAGYVEKGILFLRAQNIRSYGIDLSDVKFISSETPNIEKFILNEGDIIVNRNGINVGDAAVISSDIVGSTHGSYSIRMKPKKELVVPGYLAIALNSSLLKTQIFASKGRSTQPNINIAELDALQVPVPPLDVQSQIVELVRDAYTQAKQLRVKADNIESEARTHVEQMILGEEAP